MGGGAQHGVAEVAGGQRSQVAIALGADAVRRFVEHEQFVLEAGLCRQAESRGLRQHAAQHGAWANSMVAAVGCGELADEVRRAVFRQGAFAGGQQAVVRVRKAAVPAGDGGALRRLGIGVELVVHVPSEYAVAEAAALLQQARELLQAHELAAQYAVDVGQAQHHLADAALPIVADSGIHLIVHVAYLST